LYKALEQYSAAPTLEDFALSQGPASFVLDGFPNSSDAPPDIANWAEEELKFFISPNTERASRQLAETSLPLRL
jgi:hypothetical protein